MGGFRRERAAHGSRRGRSLSRSAGSAGGRRSIWRRICLVGELLIHYGSPMITAANTVLVPTRVSAKAGFRVVAYSGTQRRPALVA